MKHLIHLVLNVTGAMFRFKSTHLTLCYLSYVLFVTFLAFFGINFFLFHVSPLLEVISLGFRLILSLEINTCNYQSSQLIHCLSPRKQKISEHSLHLSYILIKALLIFYTMFNSIHPHICHSLYSSFRLIPQPIFGILLPEVEN